MPRITIFHKILYEFELNLDDYDELYLPNCCEIIKSFTIENESITKIIAPKLISIHSSFNFTNLSILDTPNIRYVYLYYNHALYSKNRAYKPQDFRATTIITLNEYASPYMEFDNLDKLQIKEPTHIYKDIEICFTNCAYNNEFYNCNIYNTFGESSCHNCNIYFNTLLKTSNMLFNCKIPYLGITITRNNCNNKCMINLLETSKLYEYFKETNDDGLSDDEIANILQSHCNSKNIKQVSTKYFEDIINDKDIVHDLLYLQCNDILDLFKFELDWIK